VRNADSAMYEIKRKGKGGIGSFMTGQQTSGL
jgi:GGDEF domain-containing protein